MTSRYRVLSIMPKIPEISVGNSNRSERSVSVSSTGIFGITSGGCPLISVGIFRPKFDVPFLTNRFFALMREFGKGIKMTRAIPIGYTRSIFHEYSH